jgi:hypothetical protein
MLRVFEEDRALRRMFEDRVLRGMFGPTSG